MVSLTFLFNLNVFASPSNSMPIHSPHQRAPACIFLSSTIPPNDTVCHKSSITPKQRHIYTYNIYKFICLTAMNMKYSLRTSCTGYVPMYYDIQQVSTVYKREVHTFYITKSWIMFEGNLKYAYIF